MIHPRLLLTNCCSQQFLFPNRDVVMLILEHFFSAWHLAQKETLYFPRCSWPPKSGDPPKNFSNPTYISILLPFSRFLTQPLNYSETLPALLNVVLPKRFLPCNSSSIPPFLTSFTSTYLKFTMLLKSPFNHSREFRIRPNIMLRHRGYKGESSIVLSWEMSCSSMETCQKAIIIRKDGQNHCKR